MNLDFTPEEILKILPHLTPAERAELDMLLQPTAADLESQGWQAWYLAILGPAFASNLADHHKDAISWHWEARMSQRQNRENPNKNDMSPPAGYDAYIALWSREHRKSDCARAISICDGCLSVSDGKPGYNLYVSGTKAKVKGHALSIETLLRLPSIRQYYPTISQVKRREKSLGGFSLGWTAEFIYTASGYVYHFIGLDEGVAGANVDTVRPSLITLDDIDDRENSPLISENRFHTLTRAVLPTRQRNTLVFVAQNLISRYSTTYQIHKQRARILTNRKPTEPIPAIRNLVTKTSTVDGIVKDVIVSGQPTWPAWGLDRAQQTLDTVGIESFKAEYQHEVDQSKEGLVLQNWNDSVHVITKSEFARIFGYRDIPRLWSKYTVNDWARTKTKYHANIAFTMTVSAQNSALPGCYFVFNPYSFPGGSSPEDVAERILTGISPTVRLANGEFVTWRALIKSVLQKTELESHNLTTTALIDARRNVLAHVLPKYVEPILRAQHYEMFRGSHEQSKTGALEVYRKVFGLPFHPINPGGDGGIDAINLAQRVDYEENHPIKPGVKGYTRFFLIVEDEKAEYPEALQPDDLTDSDLFRYQMANARLRDPYLTAKGEIEGEILKVNDDFINGLMFLFCDNCVQAVPLTGEERLQAAIPQGYHVDELQAREDLDPAQKALTAWYVEKLVKKELAPKSQEIDDYGEVI